MTINWFELLTRGVLPYALVLGLCVHQIRASRRARRLGRFTDSWRQVKGKTGDAK